MNVCTHMSEVFDDVVNAPEFSYACVRSTPIPYIDKPISGYVHTLNSGNAIFITDNLIPYLITIDYIDGYHLKTGDRVSAKVGYSTRYERFLVLEITEVNKIEYDDAKAVKSTRNFQIANRQVKLGTSILKELNKESEIEQEINTVFEHAPLSANKIILAFDGRETNYPTDTATVYLSKPTQSSRDKLTICLLAFFKAKELAAAGKDAILLIDSLDKMFNVFNNCMQKMGVIDPNVISVAAATDLESILCSSHCLENGGTMTIVGLHRPGISAEQLYIADRFNQIFDTLI